MSHTSIVTGFGTVAQEMRVKYGKRILDQAEALGVTPSYVTQLETGEIGPDRDYVEKLTKWLKLDIPEQLVLIKGLRHANVVDLSAERRRRKGPEIKLFRRLHSMTPKEIRAMASDDGSDK